MTEQFLSHLSKHRFPTHSPCLLAVSGGLDSMVMAHLFTEAGIPFAIGHCNFKLRGKESDGDEQFVKKFAERNKIPFHSISFKGLKGTSGIQEHARQLRYDWLEQVRKENNYTRICTAHHLDDSLETFLFHLLRGTGISGLTGIPVSHKNLFRPLLFAMRTEIEKFAKQNKIRFRTDSSNRTTAYTRNKIRKQVIPLLEKVMPGAKKNLLLSMENLSGAAQVYEDSVWSLFNEIAELRNETVRIRKDQWLKAEHKEILLYEYLSAFGFNAAQVIDISKAVHSQPGKIFRSATHMLLNDRAHFLLSPLRKEITQEEVLIREDFTEITHPLHLAFGSLNKTGKNQRTAILDKEKLKFPLCLRLWRNGDYIYPTGMTGRKKLSDLLVDQKVPRTEKEGIFVLTSGEQIVWVVGRRVDRRFAAGEQTTDYFCVEWK